MPRWSLSSGGHSADPLAGMTRKRKAGSNPGLFCYTPSSSAKADDPVRRGFSILSLAAAITGCRLRGHDDIGSFVMRMIFRCDPALSEYLPRPVPARGALPDWLRAMPAKAASEIHGRDIRTVKQCPPFVDAMAYGVLILLPCDITVNSGSFSWAWDIPEPLTTGHPRAPLSFHVAAQFPDAPFARDGQAAIKFNSFWTIELEPGWSLFATHPVNRDDLPFRLISGLVDADRFHDGGINFPAIWLQPDFTGVLPKGTPVAQCFAVPRAAPQLEFECFDETNKAAYETTVAEVLASPGVYRKRFRARRGRSST
jgi:hypothetical protein